MSGVANVPAGSVMIMSPRLARWMVAAIEALEREERCGGGRLDPEVVALREACRVLAGTDRVPAGTERTRGGAEVLDGASSDAECCIPVRNVAEQLGVSDSYLRRVARDRLAGLGLARKDASGHWLLAEEGVEMVERKLAA